MRLTTTYALVLAAGGLYLGRGAFIATRPGVMLAVGVAALVTLASSVVIWRRHPLGPVLFGLIGVGFIGLGLVNLVGGAGPVIGPIFAGIITLPGYKYLKEDIDVGRPPSNEDHPAPDASEPDASEPDASEPSASEPSAYDLPEDCRPLRELCEDPTRRRRLHYWFAHRFWPGLVHTSPPTVLAKVTEPGADVTKYMQAWWALLERRTREPAQKREPDLPIFRRVADLEAWVETIAGDPVLMVKMPVPEQTPDAYFIGVLFHSEESSEEATTARVFTLERTKASVDAGAIDATGVFCEWTEGKTHLNYELEVPPVRQRFASTIEKVVVDDVKPPMASALHDLVHGLGEGN